MLLRLGQHKYVGIARGCQHHNVTPCKVVQRRHRNSPVFHVSASSSSGEPSRNVASVPLPEVSNPETAADPVQEPSPASVPASGTASAPEPEPTPLLAAAPAVASIAAPATVNVVAPATAEVAAPATAEVAAPAPVAKDVPTKDVPTKDVATNDVPTKDVPKDSEVPAPAEQMKDASKFAAADEIKSHPVDVSDDDMFGTKGLVQELTDPQKFGKRGEAWFFAQILVMLLVLFPPIELKGLLDLVGTLAISAGFVFLIYAVLCLGRSLSPLPSPRQSNQLVTTGMYGYVRHPMYGGLLLVAVGMALVTGSESRLALSLLLWWILEQKANVEEMLLQQRHPAYAAYKERVKKFIPYVY